MTASLNPSNISDSDIEHLLVTSRTLSDLWSLIKDGEFTEIETNHARADLLLARDILDALLGSNPEEDADPDAGLGARGNPDASVWEGAGDPNHVHFIEDSADEWITDLFGVESVTVVVLGLPAELTLVGA